MDNKYERVSRPDHPERCQAMVANGQCPYKRSENTPFCPMHNGPAHEHKVQKEAIRNYRLTRYQARVNDLADNESIKSLREEIGIARMTMEAILDMCQTPVQLYLQSNKIGDLLLKIEKLVASCHKLEESTGQLLDKTAAINFASKIVEIVSSHIDNPDLLQDIGNKIVLELGMIMKPKGAE